MNSTSSTRTDTLIKNAVFLGGHPKAGTTLLLSLFDNNQEVCSLPIETQFFRYLQGKQNKIETLHKLRGIKTALKNPEHPSSKPTLKYASAIKGSNINHIDDKSAFKTIANLWIQGKQEGNDFENYKYWLEKSPFNERYLPLIKKWFKDQYKFIFIARDPRGNWASYNRRKKFQMPVKDFLYNWKKSFRIASRESKRNPNFLMIQYEHLVKNPEQTMRAICSFLGINFTENLLNPTINGSHWDGNSAYKQNGFSKISESSLDRWKTELPPETIKTIESYTKKELGELGYSATTGKSVLFPNLLINIHFLTSAIKHKLKRLF